MNRIVPSKAMLEKYLINLNKSKVIVAKMTDKIKKVLDEYNKLIESEDFQENFKAAVSPRTEIIKEQRRKILFNVFNMPPLIVKKSVHVTNQEINLYLLDCFKHKIKNEDEIDIEIDFYNYSNLYKMDNKSFNGIEISVLRYLDGRVIVDCKQCFKKINNLSNINKCITEIEIMLESENVELDSSWLLKINEICTSNVE
jgi:hypothetical protein